MSKTTGSTSGTRTAYPGYRTGTAYPGYGTGTAYPGYMGLLNLELSNLLLYYLL